MREPELVAAERIVVAFRGERSGCAGLTWAQQYIWEICRDLGMARRHYFNSHRLLPLTGEHQVSDVLRAARVLVERYEALRTTVRCDADAVPRQHVSAQGEFTVDVHDAGDGDARALAELLIAEHTGHPFPDGERLFRLALVTRAGRPAFAVLTASHVGLDRSAMDLVCTALRHLVDGDATNLPPTSHQPLDQAALEATAAGARRVRRAARYWRRTLLGVPQTLFPKATPGDSRPWSRAGWLRSTAVAPAADVLAERHGISGPVAVLAAFATLLGVRTGCDVVPMQVFVSNRFTRQSREMVGTCVQPGLFAADLRAASFEELLARTGTAVLQTYRYAQYPRRMVGEVIDEVNEVRGVDLDLRYVFHDRSRTVAASPSGTPSVPSAAAGPGEYQRDVQWDRNQRVLFEIRGRWPVATQLYLAADPHALTDRDVEGLLRGVERLLVAAVQEDVAVADVPAVTGIGGPDPTGDLVRVNGSWIDLTEVRSLLDGLPGVLASEVRLAERIVGHVATDAPGLGPRALHEACLARLPGRPAACTPGWYVVHPGLPGEVRAADWWATAPVRAQGTGRVERPPIDDVG